MWEGPLRMLSWRREEFVSSPEVTEQGRAVSALALKGNLGPGRPGQATARECELDTVCRPWHRPTLLPGPKPPCTIRIASRILSPPWILSGLTRGWLKPSFRSPLSLIIGCNPANPITALPPSPLCSGSYWALPWHDHGGTGLHWQL